MSIDLAHRALLRLSELVTFGSGARSWRVLSILRDLERDAGCRGDALRAVLGRGAGMSWLVYESRRTPDGNRPAGRWLYPDSEHAEKSEALERAAMLAARYAPAESVRFESRGAETLVFGLGAVYGAAVRESNPGKGHD